MNSFDKALSHVLLYEGGLSDHPNDPGGRTFKGITQGKLDEIRSRYVDSVLPEKAEELKDDQVAFIYKAEYWMPIHGDELPEPLAIVAMDAAVNAGVGRARRWLQQALKVKVDGWIGPGTLASAKSCDVIKTVAEFDALRAFHYMLQDSIDDDFGLGWARRLIATHNFAMGIT